MAKKTTPEEQDRILKMYTVEKMSQSQIAKVVGLTPSGVALLLHRHGIRSRNYGGLGGNRKYRLTNDQLQQMVEAYQGGASCETIAHDIGVPWVTVNRRLKQAGVQLRPAGFRRGSGHHGWVGGRHVTSDGYAHVWVRPEDPFFSMANRGHGDAGGYVLEHRLVMARQLGRPLTRYETVHHIDGDRTNNTVGNLQLRQGRHGKGAVFRCLDCGSHNIELLSIGAAAQVD